MMCFPLANATAAPLYTVPSLENFLSFTAALVSLIRAEFCFISALISDFLSLLVSFFNATLALSLILSNLVTILSIILVDASTVVPSVDSLALVEVSTLVASNLALTSLPLNKSANPIFINSSRLTLLTSIPDDFLNTFSLVTKLLCTNLNTPFNQFLKFFLAAAISVSPLFAINVTNASSKAIGVSPYFFIAAL